MKPCSRFSQWQGIALCSLMSLVMILTSERLVHAERYSLTDLGDLGGGRSAAYGLNNSGEVVGWSTVPGNTPHAFLYKNRMMMSLGISGVNASAYGINGSEQVVGRANDGHAFLYDHGHVTVLPGITSAGYGGAYAINSAGDIVGFASTSSTSYAVLWSHGTLTNLNTWDWRGSKAYGINDSGHVVGEAATKNLGPWHAFLYSNGMMTDLGTLGGPSSAGFGINNAGQVVGQAAYLPHSTEVHAFLYSNGKMMDLGGPAGLRQSVAKGINKFGHVVGWFNISGYQPRAFIYRNGSLLDLNTLLDSTGSGWILGEATAINDNGQIVCKAVNRIGTSHAVLLTPVP